MFPSSWFLGSENARKFYIEAEHSERIRRALRHNVWNVKQHFQVDDCVFYRRFGRWSGPGKVIGRDGKILYVRNGGQVAKVHETDLSCYSFDVPGSEKLLAVSDSVEEKVILEPNTVSLDDSICEPGAADDAVIAEEKIQT